MNDTQPVRIGVVGAGAMGERHARIYAQLHRAALLGVYDPDHGRAAGLATAHGVTAFASVQELFTSVDAVSIASPTSTHADVASLAIDYGLHMLIEKPLCATVHESQRLIERAAHHPECVILVGHVERFNPTVTELRRVIKRRRVLAVTMRRMGERNGRCLDTDVVHDLMIHDIDLALDLFGDRVTTIDAVGSEVYSGKIDQAVAQLCMEDEATITLIASRAAERRVRTIEIRTDDAWIAADLIARSISVTPLSLRDEHGIVWPLSARDDARIQHLTPPLVEPLRAELEHFLTCVRGDAHPLVDIMSGFRALVYAHSISELVERRARAEHIDRVLA